jgi:hypothetical protein
MNEKRRSTDARWTGRIKNEFGHSPISTTLNIIQIVLFVFTLSYGLVRFGHFQADWEKMLNYCSKLDVLTSVNAADHSVLSNSISAHTGKSVRLPSEKGNDK